MPVTWLNTSRLRFSMTCCSCVSVKRISHFSASPAFHWRAGEQEPFSSEDRDALLRGRDSPVPATCEIVLAIHLLLYLFSIPAGAAVQSVAREGRAVLLIQFLEQEGRSGYVPYSYYYVPLVRSVLIILRGYCCGHVP